MITLIIPAYNEAERIKPTLSMYLEYFKKHVRNFEFLIIIEGDDNTTSVVEEFAKKDRHIRYFYSKKRLGKGGAVIKGFKLATGDSIGFVDADGSTKPEAFVELTKELEKCDGVIASRKLPGAKLIKKEPLLQRIGSFGFNALVRSLFLLPFKDTQCGAKVFKKYVVDAVLPELELTQFSFDINLLFVAKMKGFRIKEIPTVWEYETGAQFNFKRWFAKLIPQMFLSIVRLRLLYSPFKDIVRVHDRVREFVSGNER